MKSSEQINELAAALAKAQGAFPPIERNRRVKVRMKAGGEYEFYYAPLDTILQFTVPELSANGLSLTWNPDVRFEGDYAEVIQTCRLTHSSGQWQEASITLRTSETDVQGIGSTLTYGRRYSCEHVLGIAACDDDDGNHASGNTANETERRHTAPQAKPLPAKSTGKKPESTFTSEQEAFIGDVELRMINAKNAEELQAIGKELTSQSKDVRDHLRPMYQARAGVLPTSKEQAYIADAIQNIADCPDDDAFCSLTAAIESQSEQVQAALKPHLEARGSKGFPAAV